MVNEVPSCSKVHLDGRITEAGGLELDLPAGLPAGEARSTIEALRGSERRR